MRQIIKGVCMEFKEIFEKFDIFEDLNDEEKAMLSSFLTKASYNEDDIIYNESAEGGTLYFLLKGKVRICRTSKDGDLLPYAAVNAGETFGLMSFIDGSNHSATTLADKDSEVIKIEKKDFETLLNKDPMMFAKVYKKIGIHLCEIIRDMNRQYMDLTTYMFTKSK
ncbi:Cyclic nucleotide-binding domain protein [Candidatus Magnetoovum chiemensis]|nr:Cyclic nucleotide-binding domain protein [Candidatus Magnetoovum chiemensis]